MDKVFHRFITLIPGLLLLAAIGLMAKYLEIWLQSVIHIGWIKALVSNVILAIILGMLVNNLFRIPAVFHPGLDTYEFFLKIGVIFMGAKILISDLLRLGSVGIIMVVVEILFSIGFVLFFARFFKLPQKMASLISIGVGVCGVSAIIASAPAINAKREESSYAIAVILIFGAGALVVYPLIGHLLNMPDHLFGVWAGLAVDNTAEAVATGAIYSETAAGYATFSKMCRNAMMPFVILGFAMAYARKGMTDSIKHKGIFLWQKFPKFVLGFLAMSVVFTLLLNFVKDGEALASVKGSIGTLKNFYQWAFLFTFAGVGLRTSFRDMAGAGWKPFVVGIATEASVAVFTIIMVLVFGGFIPQVL
ncbi:MAG: putative sulfate exporter family transporter [Spirochaetales bacterium]|nr:putative sulfate exporter family transporter [Spirochaetales bacterium]